MTSPSKLSLYDVGVIGAQINDYLEKTEGELSPEAEEIFDKLLREGPERLEAAAAVVRQLEVYQNECKAEEKRLAERRRAFEANAAKLKERMRWALDSAFAGKIKTAQVTLWVQQSPDTTAVDMKEGVEPVALWRERPDLVRVKYELDKLAVKACAERGDDLPDSIYIEHNPGVRSLRMK